MELRKIVDGREAALRASESVNGFEGGFALATLIDNLAVAHGEYVKQQNALVLKYGTDPDPNNPKHEGKKGKFVDNESPEFELFKTEVEALLAKDIEVFFTPLKQEYFRGEKVNGALLTFLLPFFEKK